MTRIINVPSSGSTDLTSLLTKIDTLITNTDDIATQTTLAALKAVIDSLVFTNVHTGYKELNIVRKGHVCSHNTTIIPLGANETFTGGWQDTLDYGNITVNVYTDKASKTDGLIIQWSADGSTVMDTDIFSIQAGASKQFSFGAMTRYVRVVYQNGNQAQTSFSLQTLLKHELKPSSHRIKDSIIDDDDAELVKAILSGKTAQGNFVNFSATNGGNFKTSLEEIETNVNIARSTKQDEQTVLLSEIKDLIPTGTSSTTSVVIKERFLELHDNSTKAINAVERVIFNKSYPIKKLACFDDSGIHYELNYIDSELFKRTHDVFLAVDLNVDIPANTDVKLVQIDEPVTGGTLAINIHI